MIKDTIWSLENAIQKIRNSDSDSKEKTKLLSLISRLKKELEAFSKTHREHSTNIADLLDEATDEACKSSSSAERLSSYQSRLTASVKNFEGSHPILVSLIDEMCRLLSQMGV